MAKYIGTPDEFKLHIRPRLSDLVKVWTRKHKESIGACENCGADAKLQSAHRVNNGMEDIIKRLLPPESTLASKGVDLADFEARFKAEHEPFEKAMLALCEKCHREYDAERKSAKKNKPDVKTNVKTSQDNDILPIILTPRSPKEFKKRLLETKQATITVFYKDGKIERNSWKASRFNEKSDVIGNLRSRPEFRQGEWQKTGIIVLEVSVP